MKNFTGGIVALEKEKQNRSKKVSPSKNHVWKFNSVAHTAKEYLNHQHQAISLIYWKADCDRLNKVRANEGNNDSTMYSNHRFSVGIIVEHD